MGVFTYVDNWRCLKCGTVNIHYDNECTKCKLPCLGAEFSPNAKVKCNKCRQRDINFTYNVCTSCGEMLCPNRLTGRSLLVADDLPRSIDCCLIRATEGVILSSPDTNSERLFMIGTGDLLPVLGDAGDFYSVYTVVGNGYVGKSICCKVEVGLEPVKRPLGFTRAIYPIYTKSEPSVVVYQPDGTAVPIFKINERYPIIAESDKEYKIQLDSGVRGFVSKQHFFRTITPDSVRSEKTPPSVLGWIVQVGALLALGAIGSAAQDARDAENIQRGVSRAIS